MRALIRDRYGPPDVLRVEQVDKPVPGPDHVLVRVRATSVNSWDWDELVGVFLARITAPRMPKHRILGADLAGVVEEVGAEVEDLAVGDEVYGDISWVGFGAMAEYVTAKPSALARKPQTLDFAEAASLPQAGVLAMQGLSTKWELEPGHKVLVNGGGGGVGTLAIQIAKLAGAEVTGVDRAEKLDTMRSLGADHVIDYRERSFSRRRGRYDLVLDTKVRRSTFTQRWALARGGRYASVGGTTPRLFETFALGSLLNRLGSKSTAIVMHRFGRRPLEELSALVDSGQVRPVVDSVYPLEEGAEAFRRYGSGLFKGKVVISLD